MTKNKVTIESMKAMTGKRQLNDTLGIELIEIGEDSMTAQLTVDERHLRPGGIMNGGVSLVLLETVASMSSFLFIDPEKQNSLGIQANANHLSIAAPGDVLTAKSTAVHIGRTTQLWEVNITNQKGKKISTGRLTMLITDR